VAGAAAEATTWKSATASATAKSVELVPASAAAATTSGLEQATAFSQLHMPIDASKASPSAHSYRAEELMPSWHQ